MNITEKEIIVYGLIRPNKKLVNKVESLYKKLKLEDMMTIRGFYILCANYIEKLNINKIKSFEGLFIKINRYKKHRKKLMREGKLARCYNCIFRIPRTQRCCLNKKYDKEVGLEFLVNMPYDYKCMAFLERKSW